MENLLKKEVKKEYCGQSQMVSFFIGVLIMVIIAVGVTIPTVQSTISGAGFTGTLSTVMTNVPLLIGVVVLVAIASGVAYFSAGGAL